MSNTNLRWILVTAAVLMFLPVINAGVPNLMSYQGRLTDADGVPLTGSYDLNFRIYNAQSGGVLDWTENHNNVEVTDGLFSVVLGSQGYPLTHTVFGISSTWLEIRVDGQIIGDRTQLTSVGYAQRIATIDGATGGLVTGTVTVSEELQVGGVLVPLSGSIWSGTSITIESGSGNVLIKAGSSQITVSPTGGVTIAAQDITIDAVDVLTLTAGTEVAIEAPTVDVHALSKLDLRSDFTLAIDAGANSTIHADGNLTADCEGTATLEGYSMTYLNSTGIVDINGALVLIN